MNLFSWPFECLFMLNASVFMNFGFYEPKMLVPSGFIKNNVNCNDFDQKCFLVLPQYVKLPFFIEKIRIMTKLNRVYLRCTKKLSWNSYQNPKKWRSYANIHLLTLLGHHPIMMKFNKIRLICTKKLSGKQYPNQKKLGEDMLFTSSKYMKTF